MEKTINWIAVGYDGNASVLLPFKTHGDNSHNRMTVLTALMEAHREVQSESITVSAIIEVAPGVTQQAQNLSISFPDDTLWAADII